MSEFLNQLVQRPEDILENAEERLGTYKDIMLHPLEVRKCKIIGLCITKDLLKYLKYLAVFSLSLRFVVWRWAQGVLQHIPKF